MGGLCGSRGPTPAPLASGACSSGAGRVAEPGSYLTPTPVPSAQEAARSHQQQTAHLPGKIPAEAETAVQGPPRAQDQVLYHVAQDLGARPWAQQGSRHGCPLPFAPSPPGHTHHQPSSPPPTPLVGDLSLLPPSLSTPGVCVCVCVCVCMRAHHCLVQSSFCLCPRVCLSVPSALTVPLRLNPLNLPALCPWLSC